MVVVPQMPELHSEAVVHVPPGLTDGGFSHSCVVGSQIIGAVQPVITQVCAVPTHFICCGRHVSSGGQTRFGLSMMPSQLSSMPLQISSPFGCTLASSSLQSMSVTWPVVGSSLPQTG